MLMPNSRAMGKISRSINRVAREYSISNADTGCMAWALRSCSALTSESPRYFTFPSLIKSAIAPTVSSKGTLGSTLAGCYKSISSTPKRVKE